ncbi:MAG: hypothetical protein JXQ83_05375 [Candidatus Glassbacteria bacterium]|nr:hypothetical protein [Candidatus Glassbacteria bacterium]
MSYAAAGAASGAAHAIAEAIKASGAIVTVDPEEFNKILAKAQSPLVVAAKGGFFKTSYQYRLQGAGFLHQVSHRPAPRRRGRGSPG